ncbi:MAG: GNAT family N-acetyltransferase [Lachnospiraceae bacterium]|nr:GNAT family N-acetyltransferase [Lachnospiraceae bacterium]
MPNTNHDLFYLYASCFPDYPLTAECFFDSLKPDNELTHVIRAFDTAEKMIGFAIICRNTITLICVLPEYRGKGHGARLLDEAEKYIRANNNYAPIILGYARHYIFQGVPLDYGSIGFFEKYGYTAPETTMNMGLKLADFDFRELNLPEPDDVTFRLAGKADKKALDIAIEDADSSWHQFFVDYEDPVMLAVSGQKIIGFQMLEPYGARFRREHEKNGCIGCVGIIKEARERGIGRRMVAEGICWLKEQGCVEIELLYVGMIGWYEKLGFRPVSYQWMGKKV